MELSTLLPFIAVLACPVAMGLMMWWMNKEMNDRQEQPASGKQTAAERLAALRQQRQTIETEIAELARLVELEAQRDSLLKANTGRPIIREQ
jgi:hypothetical protein